MQIKLIAEGSSKWDRFTRSWGVSFLVNDNILFDVFGHPGGFLNNMRRMKIDLSKIQHIILSHDHWDHITGMWGIINGRKDIKVYVCPGFKEELKERIKSRGATLIEVSGPLEISPNIFLTGQMTGQLNGEDVFEQSCIIRTEKGIILLAGCSHPGILNILSEVKKQFREVIYFVIGGLHLKNSKKEDIEKVISGLRAAGVVKIAPLHCSGNLVVKLIKKEYQDLFVAAKAGNSLYFT